LGQPNLLYFLPIIFYVQKSEPLLSLPSSAVQPLISRQNSTPTPMGKKRERHQNPQPFLSDDNHVSSSNKRSKSKPPKAPKPHQTEDNLISSDISSKILKQAMAQQKEIHDEANHQNPTSALLFAEEYEADAADDDDIDDFGGFSETQSRLDAEEIDEEDERVLDAFLTKDAGPQRTLADLIVEKLKQNDPNIASGSQFTIFVQLSLSYFVLIPFYLIPEMRPLPKLDNSIIELYKGYVIYA
jgi:essential nuclear protein 1